MSTGGRGQAQQERAKMAEIKPIRGQAKPGETRCAEFGAGGREFKSRRPDSEVLQDTAS
jgi:hypothetical protein